MESIEVGSELLLVAVSAGRWPFHLPGDVLNRRDLVSRVTIDAHWRLRVPGFQLSAMDSRKVGSLRSGVAGTASRGDIGPVGTALGIRVIQYLVCSVATRTGRSYEKTVLGQGEAMDGIHVQGIHVWQAKLLCELGIPMTRTARLGYV
jgi:hypothetical protein